MKRDVILTEIRKLTEGLSAAERADLSLDAAAVVWPESGAPASGEDRGPILKLTAEEEAELVRMGHTRAGIELALRSLDADDYGRRLALTAETDTGTSAGPLRPKSPPLRDLVPASERWGSTERDRYMKKRLAALGVTAEQMVELKRMPDRKSYKAKLAEFQAGNKGAGG